MCGSSSEQNQVNQAQIGFYNALTQNYKTTFGQNQAILNELQSSLAPIIAAGPNQQGFSQGELTALDTQATDASAQNYKQASQALNERFAAAGGNQFIPSGAQEQLNSELATSSLNNLTNNRLGITEKGFDVGRQNFTNAVGALSAAPG